MSRPSNKVAASTGAGAGIGRPAGPVRWGVIGAGGIADRRMIPEGILPASNARLGALMDTNAALREPLEKKYGVPFFATVGELLSQPVDAVYIATPTHLHEE